MTSTLGFAWNLINIFCQIVKYNFVSDVDTGGKKPKSSWHQHIFQQLWTQAGHQEFYNCQISYRTILNNGLPTQHFYFLNLNIWMGCKYLAFSHI